MPDAPTAGRAARSIRAHLLLLVLGVLLPALAFGCIVVWRFAAAEQVELENEARDVARDVTATADRALAGLAADARVLAGSEALEAGDLAAFQRRATEAQRALGAVDIVVRDAGSRQILNTNVPWGRPLPNGTHLASVDARAAAANAPAFSDLFVGLSSSVPQFAVVLPLTPSLTPPPGAAPGAPRFLSVSLAVSHLQHILERATLPSPGMTVAIIDRGGLYLARSRDPAHRVGRPAPAATVAAPGRAGLMEGRSAEGVPSLLAYRASALAGWRVVVSVPDHILYAPQRRALAGLALVGTAALLLALAAALVVGRRMTGAMAALAGAAADLGRGGTVTPPLTRVSEANAVGAVLAEAARARLAAEAAQRASEARLRAALESTGDSVLVISPDWRLLYANQHALDLIGPNRPLPGRLTRDVFPEGIHTPLGRAFLRCMKRRVPTEAEQFYGPLGRHIAARAFPSQDGGITVFFRDVTDERSAAERDARLAAIVASSPDAMVSFDTEGRITSWNRGAERLFGYTEAEVLTRSGIGLLAPAEGLPAGDPGPQLPRVLRGETLREFEAVRVTKDGRRIAVTITATRMFAPDGRVIGVCTIYRDIRARRAAEAVLARDRAELERLVEERTRDLRQTQARLAQAEKLAALGQLAGGIAHDFNNVLQTVQGGAGLIGDRPDEAERVRRLAHMVTEAAERGAAITRRLLAFARRADLRAEPLDPAALLAEMREVLAHTLGAGIAVRVEAEAGLPPLLADKGQLDTVLVNLATNARDAMPEGGTITLRAQASATDGEDGPGGAARLPPGRYVCLAVTDTGAGMTQEVLARVSEPFFTTKPQGKGTGLGLAMARGFAEQSGGALTIESAPGCGTTVRMWFPVATGIAAVPPPPSAAGAPLDGRPRILLVDDEALVRAMLAEQLREDGYAVQEAEGGGAALERLDGGAVVDVLVTDLSMPGMDGIALIRAAQQRRPDLPAILLTGYATDAAELAVGRAVNGRFALLRKPVERAALAQRVAHLLRGGADGRLWRVAAG